MTDASLLSNHYQGVLYKRRDVFTRQWRPRWFVLQPETGILTYYLFSKSDEPPSITMSNTPGRRRQQTRFEQDEASLSASSERQAAAADSSSIQYDVVPRGTIYLRGCTVAAVVDEAEAATAYCFVITAPDHSTTCCLATRTAEARTEWVQRLSLVCSGEDAATADGVEEPASDELRASDEEADQEAPEAGFNDDTPSPSPDDVVSEQDTEDDVEKELMMETSIESDAVIPPPIEEAAAAGWKDLKPGMATAGLTPDMKNRVDSVMKEYLPYVFETKQDDWSLMFENKNGVTSHHREHSNSASNMMIKSVMPRMKHHPKQVFNLVADTKKRQEYETNIRRGERLKRCNAHTFIDYYAYNAVWPTMARDFLVLFHWRTMVRPSDGQKAILVMAFSYPPCDDLKPPTPNHVRGDLAISLFWLEQGGDDTTSATRLLSYSLCGNIPQPLTNTIMQQQATLPYAISCYLDNNQSTSTDLRLTQGDINNRVLVTDVIDRLSDDDGSIDGVRRRLQFNESSSNYSTSGDNHNDDDWQMVEHSETSEKKKNTSTPTPSPLLLTIILLTPLVLYNLMTSTDGPRKEVIFLISALLAVRTVVLLQLGSPLPEHDTTGVVSCQFAVNLRGVLRLLAAQQEQQRDGLSVVPLVVKAVAKILNDDMEALNSIQTSIPLLGLDGYYCRGENIHVSVQHHPNDVGSRNSVITTVKNASKLTNEQVATALGRRSPPASDTWWEKLLELLGIQGEDDLGSCLVVTSPDSDGRVVNVVQVAPGKCFNVVVAIGGVRMAKHVQYGASPTPRKPPKPLLTMSVTVDCPAVSVADCRRFSEKLQELLEYPDDA